MCNLYSVTKGQAAIIALMRALRDRTGNLPSMPGVFPATPAFALVLEALQYRTPVRSR
jgi:hypothetical protein